MVDQQAKPYMMIMVLQVVLTLAIWHSGEHFLEQELDCIWLLWLGFSFHDGFLLKDDAKIFRSLLRFDDVRSNFYYIHDVAVDSF